MNEANASLLAGPPPPNPLNINIEFNINNARPTPHDVNHIIRGKKMDHDVLNLKNPCACHVSKTPELAQTDREAYSKEMEYLRPVEDRRKKSKRNSMDINATNRSINQLAKGKFSKGNTTILKKSDALPYKADPFKKKRSHLKSDFDPYRKPTAQTRELKSMGMQSRSQKKTAFHKSLKNIIHRIVNNELSKRSLSGITNSKTKSPYQAPSFALNNNTARKRTNKKKNLSCKSERGVGMQDTSRQQIVEKLNSLKSMTNSILRSEVQELQMPYYSKQRGKIRIQTDHSIDLIDQISFYEKKTKKHQRREAVNRAAVDQTNKLIQTYIQLMNEEERDNRTDSEINQLQSHNQIMEMSQTVRVENPRKIRDIISNQMKQLFDRNQFTQNFKQVNLQNSEKAQPSQQQKMQNTNENMDKFRGFMSSQMERPVTVSSQLQRLKLQQLKKQQIQKWGYLLQFIKKNMHCDEADTQTVLNEVYMYLQRSKNDLQRDLQGQISIQQQKKSPIDDDFTVKYSEKRENENNQYYQQPQQQLQHQNSEEQSKEIQQEVTSFKQEYTEQNQDLKLLSLETISSALKQRQISLDRQRDKQIALLQQKRQNGKISETQYTRQLARIEKWTRKQLAEIKRAKKNIWKGYHQAKGVLDKTVNSRYFEDHQNSSTKKMMKCLSETYLKKPRFDYKKLLQRQQSNRSSSQQQSSEVDLSQGQAYQYQQSKKKQPLPQIKKPQFQQRKPQSQIRNKVQQQEQIQYKSSSSAQVDLESSDHFAPEDKAHLSDHADPDSEQVSRSQQMEEIKQRLLRMKRQHYGIEDEDNGEEDAENHINYEQIQKSLEEEYSDEQISIINNQVGHSFLPNKNSELQKFKQLQNKLKYCCAEDKEDIFQFIFLDLCIELYQEPCKDNKIMKSINDHVNRAKNQAKKKKGVKTNLNVVKEYLKRFTAFLFRTNKNCLQNLNNPMGPTALEMLRYMHDSDYDIPEEEEEVPTLIIPISVFDKFQQSLLPTLEFEEYYDDPDKEQARVNFLKTILHIHNKALFDSLNEFMDHERPFGIWGKPFPWKKSSSFTHKFSELTLQEKLKKGAQKVVEQCSYVCGLLVDKQESLVGNAKISESYVQQIREDRLSRMLANELVQSEQRWLFYDDEQTEVLVQISSYVWNLLVYQVRNEIASLHRNA